MKPPDQDLERRRPVWEALSTLFLDTEIDDEYRRCIARTIVDSNYRPSEMQAILWDEVFPVVESNLRDFFGVWDGFDLDWMQGQILSGGPRRTLVTRMIDVWPYSPARIIRKEWEALLPFLPMDFRHHHDVE